MATNRNETTVKRAPRPSAPRETRRPAEAAKPPARRALRADAAFFTRIGHPDGHLKHGDPTVDRMVAAAGNPPVDGTLVVAVGQAMGLGFQRAQIGRGDSNDADSCRCGWWWCRGRADPTTPWGDLCEALHVLENHAIDPWNPSVADVALSFQRMVVAGEHHADMDKLFNVIADFKVSGLASHYRQRFLDELSGPHLVGMLATWRGDGESRSDQRPGYAGIR